MWVKRINEVKRCSASPDHAPPDPGCRGAALTPWNNQQRIAKAI
jgi:hypothetical protein